MSDPHEMSVIGRMARAARAEFDARRMSPAKALRLSLERAGDRLFGLALSVATLEQRRVGRDALKGEIDPDSLIVLLDGAGGARGAAVFDRPLVQALIEVQTTGRLRPGPPPMRPFTATDAAMTAALIDAVMAGFEDQRGAQQTGPPDGQGGIAPPPDRLRFGDRIADARALALTLAPGGADLDLFRFTIDIAHGASAGTLTLMLPRPAPEPAARGGAGSAAGTFDMAAAAMAAPVTLDAVLDRLHLSLAEVGALRPGMVLPLGPAAIGRTELVAAGGHVGARGRLGRINGFRAVRLADLTAPEHGAAVPARAAITAPAPPMPRSPEGPSGVEAQAGPAATATPLATADAGPPAQATDAPGLPDSIDLPALETS